MIACQTSTSVHARALYTDGTLQAIREARSGEKHTGAFARNEDGAIKAAGPQEAVQSPHQPLAEARVPKESDRWRVVNDCSRWQGRKLDEEIRHRRRL